MKTKRKYYIALVYFINSYQTDLPGDVSYVTNQTILELSQKLEISFEKLLALLSLVIEIATEKKSLDSVDLSTEEGECLLSLMRIRIREHGFYFQVHQIEKGIQHVVKGTDVSDAEAFKFVRGLLRDVVGEIGSTL